MESQARLSRDRRELALVYRPYAPRRRLRPLPLLRAASAPLAIKLVLLARGGYGSHLAGRMDPAGWPSPKRERK